MVKKYIAVAGNIGAGKSCLTDFLCREYSLKPFYEPVEINPYLEDFYKNMKKWSFHSQIHYLAHKFRIHLELEKETTTVVQDRTIYEDARIFATNLFNQEYMSQREFDTYWDLFTVMCKSLKPPDLMIYLKCSVKNLKKRIAGRGRKMEQKIPDKYLRDLNKLYQKWFDSYNLSPVIVYESEKYDYLSDFLERRNILKKIEKYL
ncbi:deoxynucleoside kinase [bacterium]|nr:deoxynucleoside kinase [bacterium]